MCYLWYMGLPEADGHVHQPIRIGIMRLLWSVHPIVRHREKCYERELSYQRWMTLICLNNKLTTIVSLSQMRFHSRNNCYGYGDITGILLEYLKGNRGVLDGNNNPTMVQVENVMLLLKNLEMCDIKRFGLIFFQIMKSRTFLMYFSSWKRFKNSSDHTLVYSVA